MTIFEDRYKEWGFPQEDLFLNKTCIRVNTNLISPKKLITRLEENQVALEKVPFLTNGYYVESDFPLASSLEFLQGLFYIQEAPAQVPGEIIKEELKTKKFDEITVLDMCAAPGGKTTQIAEAMRNKGKIIALDTNEKRAEKLCYNLERMKVTNVDVYVKDASMMDEKFDIILVDAPCSGNFTQDEDWFYKRKLNDFKNRQKLQKELIKNAILLLKPKGLLVYSTCSLEKEENEEVVEYALEKGVILEPHNITAGNSGLTESTKDCLRFWPTQDNQPGFFVAKLRKD